MSIANSWISGWGVVRLSPWDFAGLHSTSEPAEESAAEMGGDYVVKYGDHRVGTAEFVFDGAPRP